jgi:hypothetical protein
VTFQRLVYKLNLSEKLSLAVAGMAVFAGPVISSLISVPQVRAQSPQTTSASLRSFDVASVKVNESGGEFCTMRAFSCYLNLGQPGLVTATNVTPRDLMEKANNNVTMDAFVTQLSGSIDTDRTVVNRTGLFRNSHDGHPGCSKSRNPVRNGDS